MKWLLLLSGFFILVFLVVLIVRLFQPAKHSVTRSIRLRQKLDSVSAVLDRSADLPNWSSLQSSFRPETRCLLQTESASPSPREQPPPVARQRGPYQEL